MKGDGAAGLEFEGDHAASVFGVEAADEGEALLSGGALVGEVAACVDECAEAVAVCGADEPCAFNREAEKPETGVAKAEYGEPEGGKGVEWDASEAGYGYGEPECSFEVSEHVELAIALAPLPCGEEVVDDVGFRRLPDGG